MSTSPNVTRLSPAQSKMIARGEHHRIDVARSAAACSAWHRTRNALVRKGLVESSWPRDCHGLVFRIVFTPEGHEAFARITSAN